MKKQELINFYDLKAVKEHNTKAYNPGFPKTDIKNQHVLDFKGRVELVKQNNNINELYIT